MENNYYKTLYRGGCCEVIEKKSRFLAEAFAADEEDQALATIAKLKKQYWNASHHCYAFTIGKNHELQRCSDDGEPGGTAGRPMLEILLQEDIHNVVIVVTRYFGGTLLGTGGLVRAYQKAAQEVLNNSTIIKRQQGSELMLRLGYQELGKVQYLIARHAVDIIETSYLDYVRIKLAVPSYMKKEFMADIIEGTNGKAQIEEEHQIEFAKADKKIIFF